MDTANDFRILMAEKGVLELNRLASSLKIPKKQLGLLSTLNSEIQAIKYSYLSPQELMELESLRKLVDVSKDIRSTLKIENYTTKLASYWLEYLEYLPKLLSRGEIQKAYEAVRYFSCKILSRQKLGSLFLCIVEGDKRLEVVTNSEDLAKRQSIVVSYLPPRKFGEFVSGGMFVDASLKKIGELDFEEIRSIKSKLTEVETVLINIVRSR
ncbi:MAG: RNA-binding protein [Archaeoglobaceae archaeon]